MAGAPSRPRQTQAERRKASERKLLAAAAQVVAEKGSAKATFAEIAAVAGQSHSNPHYLFGSKANMLAALVDDFADLFREQVVGGIGDTSGLDAILTVVKLFIRSLRDPLTMTRAFYVLLGESLSTAPELRDGLNTYHQDLLALVQGWIEEGVEAGDVRPDVDAISGAVLVVSIIRGLGFLALSDPDAYDLRAIEAMVVAQIEQALRAEGAPPDTSRPAK